MSDTRDVFGGEHLLDSMRNSGYETVYALAEIIDNSIEANAKNIEVICIEGANYGQRATKQIDRIAIVDDGHGMSREDLWNALRMGEGTRRVRGTLGKFGLGLPNASMSQCRRVEVYSWRNHSSALYTVLGPECVSGGKVSIKRPRKKPVPEDIMAKSSMTKSKSGTLVIWSDLDRVPMKKGRTLIDNYKLVLGRIYRHMIYSDGVKIRMMSFYKNEEPYTEAIVPNDPLYQMIPSSTPAPFDNKAMFQTDGERWIETPKIAGHEVKVSYAYVTKEGRKFDERGRKAGSQPHGKHADYNLGISIVREKRELYLDTNLCQTYDPMERWWGVEVAFTRELDDMFNVTNSKQAAVNFSTMTKRIGSKLRVEERADAEDDEMWLYDFVNNINSRISQMRKEIKKLNPQKQYGSKKPPPIPWPPNPDPPEPGPPMTEQEKIRAITEALSKFNPEGASERAKEILREKLPATLQLAQMGDDIHDFFNVEFPGGVAVITLNQDHPVYKHLLRFAEDGVTDPPTEQLAQIKATLNSIIYSWARLEYVTPVPAQRADLRTARQRWGEQLYKLLINLYE